MKTRWTGREAKKLLFWSATSFVGLQVALNFYMEICHAEVYDPEFRDRLVLLRTRVRENPNRPLLLVVGSSRLMTGFAPEQLPPLESSGGASPLPFNAVHTGAGAVHNLLMVHRLLREGFEPRWMLVEVVPYLLPAHQHSTLAKLSLGRDLPILRHHVPPTKLYGWYLEERAAASVNHRHAFLRQMAPDVPLQDSSWDCMPMEPLGGKTWTEPTPDRAEIARRTAVVKSNYYPKLQRFQVHESARQATRELLDLCRERRIAVALVITPESSEFRGWYSPEALEAVRQFCGQVENAYGVPIVDARTWLDDEDFSDGHHVLPEGARRFTARLGAEVLQPLITGKLHNTGPILVRAR